MPRAMTVCAEPGCPALVPNGRCERHARPAWQGSTRRARLPRDWRRIRLRVLRRDGWLCQVRGPGCTRVATEVDHVDAGDDHRPENLRGICSSCHKVKTAAESAAARSSAR